VLTICGWSSIGFATTYTLAAWSPALAVALVFVTLAHLGGGAQWTLSTYGLQRRVPDAVLGRVMSGDFAIVTLVLSVTSIAAGLASGALGVRWAITVFAAIAAIAGSVYLLLTRDIRRRADETRDEAHAAPPGGGSGADFANPLAVSRAREEEIADDGVRRTPHG
jgi:hypothetical protein